MGKNVQGDHLERARENKYEVGMGQCGRFGFSLKNNWIWQKFESQDLGDFGCNSD